MVIQYDNFGNTNIARFGVIKGSLVVEMHMHQFTEIIVPLKGDIVITVNEDKNLLIKSDLRIVDIALERGFSGERSFYRAFSELVDCTPANFKNNKRFKK